MTLEQLQITLYHTMRAIQGSILAMHADTASFIEERFVTKTDYKGKRWRRRKDNKPHPLLIETGRMKKAGMLRTYGYKTINTSRVPPVRITTIRYHNRTPYAHKHQHGTNFIPRRSFIPDEHSTQQQKNFMETSIYKNAIKRILPFINRHY